MSPVDGGLRRTGGHWETPLVRRVPPGDRLRRHDPCGNRPVLMAQASAAGQVEQVDGARLLELKERALSVHGFVVVGQGGKEGGAELHGMDGPIE